MAQVGIRELRAALATWIRRAQAGERVVITADGSPVAELSAVGTDFSGVTMTDLLARGAVLAPRRRGDFVPGEPVLLSSGSRIDRALGQVRA